MWKAETTYSNELPNRLRYLFITTNLSGGGAEKALVKIAHLLRQRGNDVCLLIIENLVEHALPAGLPVKKLNPDCPSHGWFGKRLNALKLHRWVKHNGPFDLIVSTLPYADEIARLARLPRHVCRIANTLGAEIGALQRHSPAKAERRLARYRALYGRHALVAVSRGVADNLRATLLAAGPIVVMPNPFDLEGIRAQAAMTDTTYPPRPYVLHVGRFSPQKRHDLLLDAWTLLPEAPDLVLLASPQPALMKMITNKGLQHRVHVAGFQTNPYPWMAQARLLVLCSDHEGLPNVLLEALACGTPVVSTDCPSGPAEILRDLPECLTPCGDARSLAETIDRCLHTPPDLDRMDFGPYQPEIVAAGWEALARSPLTHRG